MYSHEPNTENSHQTFISRLPQLPPLSPLIFGSPDMLDFIQTYQKDLECPDKNSNPFTSLQGDPSSESVSQKDINNTLHHNETYIKNDNPVSNISLLHLGTERGSSSWDQMFATFQTNDSGSFSTCPELNSPLVNLPPLHDVGAFHAQACIVDVVAPPMQRGLSHSAEVMDTLETEREEYNIPTSSSPKSAIDFEFLSLSPLFSSQHDDELLSPSWKLKLTLSTSWHMEAESARSSSQPVAQGSSLVRRPATRRRSAADPDSPKIPNRKSLDMNGSRTPDLSSSRKRTIVESGILRTMNSPALKSHGYRVRFEGIGTR